MSLGQTYFVKVRHYLGVDSPRSVTLLETRNLYIPYAPYSGRPSGTLMTYGVVTDNYLTNFRNWMPDSPLLTCIASYFGAYAPCPTQHFLNIFPNATPINIEGSATGYWDIWECVDNGRVWAVKFGTSGSTFWEDINGFLNSSEASHNGNMGLCGVGPNDGSGATRGQISFMFYGGVDSETGLPNAFYSIGLRGARSTTNNVNIQGYTPFASTTNGAIMHWLSDAAQPLSPGSSDPYDDLPVGGDEPIPGGGAVGIPGFPGLTATSAGVIGLFAPSAAQMQLLADFMWTDFGGTGTTVEDILKEVVEALKRSISNPLDYIIGLNIIPSQGLSIGASKVVRFGFISSGVSMPLLANQYFTVDCGALSFDTVCGDTFLDYAPYSKFSIYLPYIGFKDVDPNDFVGHTIGVVYHGDCVTGGVTAYITKDGTVMYQYSGCCALNVPLSADNWGETISAAINVATGIVAAAATGGAAGLAQGALKGAASVAANPSLLSPQVSHSGAVSGGAGCMGVQFPFVIREAVNFHSTAGFNKSTGYPAYYYRKLGDVTGFTTVIDAHLSNIPMATQDEIAEIESLLESGVIL